MKKLIHLLLIISFSFTSQCFAAGGLNREVVITSDPAGADIFIDGHYHGRTPQSIPFRPNSKQRIIVQKDGYEAQYVDLRFRKMRPMACNTNLRYGLYPIGGAVIGAVAGLIATKGSVAGIEILVICATSGAGLVVGSAIGLIGLGTNIIRHSRKNDYHHKKIHFTLQKNSMGKNKSSSCQKNMNREFDKASR